MLYIVILAFCMFFGVAAVIAGGKHIIDAEESAE